MSSDVAMTDNYSIMHDMALEEVVVNEPIKMGEWEEWTPIFYPVYEEPSFPLPELSTETILCLCDEMNPKDQARFLLSINSIAQRPDIKTKLFQLKREHRLRCKLLREWAYCIRWIKPREVARMMPDREDRISCAYRHRVKFNRNTRTERMSINDIARVWGVYGTELRDEIDWQEGDDDSSDDGIMQQ